ncbi:MAG: MFS transporter [Phycisphaerae bacterium]|jgi:dipeptide/tripeptide permease
MAESAPTPTAKLSWKFPRTFWYANGAELCERFAFYGMFITLLRYLNRDIGFTDAQAGIVSGTFSSAIYLFPTFMGIMADKIGFKQALIIAFALLTGGYTLLGAFQLKVTALAALALIMLGGAIIKPVISGTVAKTSDAVNRARAMSIFYMTVNIGSFTGKLTAGPLNEHFGLRWINFYAAGMTLVALVLVAVYYKNPDIEGTGKTVGEALRGLVRVLGNVRFDLLIIIIGGFWAIQGQLYGAMPTYIERLLGTQYKPEWLANINPLVVVLCVVPITHLVRNFKPASAIGIGLFIIPFTALLVALAPVLTQLTGATIDMGFFTTHPMILLFVVGIGLQGLAECFLSPKWLEFASKQAPKGEVGLYLGYSHLTTCVSWLFAFILAGFLLERYCPDPRLLEPEVRTQWRVAIDPHYRCPLDVSLTDGLTEGGAVPVGVVTALAAQGVEVPPTATLHEAKIEGQWKQDDPGWEFQTPQGKQTIVRVEFPIATVEQKTWFQKVADFFVTTDEEKVTEAFIVSEVPPEGERPAVPAVYDNAHYIWYAFTGVGFSAFIGLLVYKFVTERIDRRRARIDTA